MTPSEDFERLACALATSDTFLIIMRGIQGLAPRRCCPPRCRS
jgi:hypothetical protein